MSSRYFLLLLLIGLFFIFNTVQGSCRTDMDSFYTNATDQVVMDDPFHTPAGLFSNGSGRWTWTLDTQSSAAQVVPGNGNTSIVQALRLTIDPQSTLFSQYKYIGCGAIIHGIAYDKVVDGQTHLSGGCDGFLSDECRQALLEDTEYRGAHHQFPAADNLDGACDELELLGGGRFEQCRNDFGKHMWLEPFLWASPELDKYMCNATKYNPNKPYLVRTWGSATYNSTDLTAYNNLTTLVEPIITTLLMHEWDPVFEGENPNTVTSATGWAKAQIMCMRTGKHISNGSVPAPSEVPRSLSARIREAPKARLSVIVGGLVFLAVL